MKERRRGRSMCALSAALGALLCALTAWSEHAYGATGIETDRTCRIDFTFDMDILDKAGETQNWGEAQRTIGVNLYKVAQVDEGGHYTLLDGYKTAEALKGVEKADNATTAKQWAQWAQEAEKIAVGTVGEDGEPAPPPGGSKIADYSMEVALQDKTATGYAEGLATGLYLVSVEPVDTASYRYSFIPYLVSLPNNYCYISDNSDASDEWIYGDKDDKRIYIGLKPEREDRYGDLVIEKTIRSYNTTFEGASFVFEVKAVKEGKLVYSDVVSLNFEGPGTKQAKVENIPAGADVAVTEVYSGAGYSPEDGAATKTAHVKAKDDAKSGHGIAAKVSFVNQYDDVFHGGNASVVNHFVYTKNKDGEENLEWEKVEGDSQGEPRMETGGADR